MCFSLVVVKWLQTAKTQLTTQTELLEQSAEHCFYLVNSLIEADGQAGSWQHKPSLDLGDHLEILVFFPSVLENPMKLNLSANWWLEPTHKMQWKTLLHFIWGKLPFCIRLSIINPANVKSWSWLPCQKCSVLQGSCDWWKNPPSKWLHFCSKEPPMKWKSLRSNCKGGANREMQNALLVACCCMQHRRKAHNVWNNPFPMTIARNQRQ